MLIRRVIIQAKVSFAYNAETSLTTGTNFVLNADLNDNKKRPMSIGRFFGTPCGNRTHNGPLGGGCYIHLTKEALSVNLCYYLSLQVVITNGYTVSV